VRIELATSPAHHIDDISLVLLLSLLVADSDAVTVAADPAARIDKHTIVSARAKRRQLQRAAALDRGFDKLIVQERADIGPEFRVPF
jgi:hypothetical protein